MKVSQVVVEEFFLVAGALDEQATEYGFDLSRDEDVNRLNLITDGERIVHKRLPKGKIPLEWKSANFAERVLGTAFDFLHQLDVTIKKSPDDTNECKCCNSEARAIRHLSTLNFLLGFLSSNGLREFNDEQQAKFFSSLGRDGAQKRHAPMAALRSWAIEGYKAGEWKSANQAAHALKDSVIRHGRTIGAHLSEENAQRTIAEWFRKSV
jgi:hypothetical protein